MIAVDEIQLDTQLSFEKFTNPKVDKEIISNHNFREGDWNEICKIRNVFEGVTKKVLPIDFRDFCMLVITEVRPGTKIPKHTHTEGIVRYVLKGSLKLNGVVYKEADWIMVPESVAYEIETDEGYTAIAGYLQACQGGP